MIFWAGAGNDQLFGGLGEDVLTAGAGNDVLDGGDHNDFLTGDAGVDVMTGGAGKDIFDFNAMTDSGNAVRTRDVIVDFQVDPSNSTAFVDRFDLSTIDAKASTVINDMFSFIGSAAFFAEGQVRGYTEWCQHVVVVQHFGQWRGRDDRSDWQLHCGKPDVG